MLEPQDGQRLSKSTHSLQRRDVLGIYSSFHWVFSRYAYGIPYFDASRVQKASVDFQTYWLVDSLRDYRIVTIPIPSGYD